MVVSRARLASMTMTFRHRLTVVLRALDISCPTVECLQHYRAVLESIHLKEACRVHGALLGNTMVTVLRQPRARFVRTVPTVSLARRLASRVLPVPTPVRKQDLGIASVAQLAQWTTIPIQRRPVSPVRRAQRQAPVPPSAASALLGSIRMVRRHVYHAQQGVTTMMEIQQRLALNVQLGRHHLRGRRFVLAAGQVSILMAVRAWTVSLDSTTTILIHLQSVSIVLLGHTRMWRRQRSAPHARTAHTLQWVRLNASTVRQVQQIWTQTHPLNAQPALLGHTRPLEAQSAQTVSWVVLTLIAIQQRCVLSAPRVSTPQCNKSAVRTVLWGDTTMICRAPHRVPPVFQADIQTCPTWSLTALCVARGDMQRMLPLNVAFVQLGRPIMTSILQPLAWSVGLATTQLHPASVRVCCVTLEQLMTTMTHRLCARHVPSGGTLRRGAQRRVVVAFLAQQVQQIWTVTRVRSANSVNLGRMQQRTREGNRLALSV